MKTSRIFVSAGAIVLGIVGIFATKPEKKFGSVTSARFPSLSGSPTVSGLNSANFTTIKGDFGITVYLVTAGAKNANPALSTLKTNISTNTAKVYYH